MPGIKPFYAVKCFPDKHVLQTIKKHNFGFDCASRGEIKRVINYVGDLSGSDFIFANPGKSIDDIKYAKSNNIDLYTADSVEELIKLNTYHPYSRVMIRIIGDETYSLLPFSSKFGANHTTVRNMLDYFPYHSLDFNGFSFHLGSNCTDITGWNNSLQIVDQFVSSANQLNLKTKIIDIGGGFMNTSQLIPLYESIKTKIENYTSNGIRIIAEPGRLFAAPIVDIYVKITCVRTKIIDNKIIYNITVNDSTYANFNAIFWDDQTFVPIPLWHDNEQVVSNIYGQTCDSRDIICKNIMLPKPILNGWMRFTNAGAYTVSAGSHKFNGFRKSKKYYIET